VAQFDSLPFPNVVNIDQSSGTGHARLLFITARSVAFIGDENADCAPAFL